MTSDPNQPQSSDFLTAEEEAKQRHEMILSLFRGRLHWAVLLGLILGTSAAVAAYFSQEPTFSASARLRVAPELDTITNTGENTIPAMFGAYLQEQIGRIESYDIAQRAIDSDTWRSALSVADAEDLSPGAFARALDAETPSTGTQYMIDVGFTSKHRELAAAGVNAAVEAYVDAFRDEVQSSTDRALNSIASELQKNDLAINDARQIMALHVPLEQQLTLDQDIQSVNKDLTDIRRDLRATTTALNFFGPTADESDGSVLQDPKALQMQAEIDAIEGEISGLLLSGFGEQHHKVAGRRSTQRTLKNELEKYRNDIASGTITGQQGAEYAGLHRSRQKLEEQERELQARKKQLTDMRAKVDGPMRRIEKLEEDRSRLDQERNIRRRDGDAAKDRVRVMQFANDPSEPSNSGKRLQMALLGMIVGGSVGVSLVAAVGLLDSRLRHAADAANSLRDARMLGVLPSLPDQLNDPEQAERAAHSVNHIRTLLQISSRGVNAKRRVFAVTGPAAGSGKSSLTIALGLSYAASGQKTLMVDGDLIGAGLTRRLGAIAAKPFGELVREDGRVSEADLQRAERHAMIRGMDLREALLELNILTAADAEQLNRRQADSSLGILDVCNDCSMLDQCVTGTGIQDLDVLPVGNAMPQDVGLLSPEMKRNLIAAAREKFDIVLIDTGPVLGSLEASMAAAEADATVLIVSRGDSKSIATRSLEHLRSVGANVAGVVFNHALESDMAEASYGSLVSQDRRPSSTAAVEVDPAMATRFGPLGSAVATYGPGSRRLKAAPMQPPPTPPAPGGPGSDEDRGSGTGSLSLTNRPAARSA